MCAISPLQVVAFFLTDPPPLTAASISANLSAETSGGEGNETKVRVRPGIRPTGLIRVGRQHDEQLV
jgi:hypothetical protein